MKQFTLGIIALSLSSGAAFAQSPEMYPKGRNTGRVHCTSAKTATDLRVRGDLAPIWPVED